MSTEFDLKIAIIVDMSQSIDSIEPKPVQTCVTATLSMAGENGLKPEDLTEWKESLSVYKESLETRLIELVRRHKKLGSDWADANLEGLRKPMTEECQGATEINGCTSTAPIVSLVEGTAKDAQNYRSSQGSGASRWTSWFTKGGTVVCV